MQKEREKWREFFVSSNETMKDEMMHDKRQSKMMVWLDNEGNEKILSKTLEKKIVLGRKKSIKCCGILMFHYCCFTFTDSWVYLGTCFWPTCSFIYMDQKVSAKLMFKSFHAFLFSLNLDLQSKNWEKPNFLTNFFHQLFSTWKCEF